MGAQGCHQGINFAGGCAAEVFIHDDRVEGPLSTRRRGSWMEGRQPFWRSLGICSRPPESSDCGGGRRCGSRVAPRSAESDSTEHGRGLQLNQPLQAVAGKLGEQLTGSAATQLKYEVRCDMISIWHGSSGWCRAQPKETGLPTTCNASHGINPLKRGADAGAQHISKSDNISKADNQSISLDDSISWCSVHPIYNNRFDQHLIVITNFSPKKIFAMLTLDQGIISLSHELEHKRLVVFVGSGMSKLDPSKLPDWNDFISAFIDFCDSTGDLLPSSAQNDFKHVMADAKKNADQIRVADVLRDYLIKLENEKGIVINFKSAFRNWFVDFFSSRKPNSYHHLITKIDFPYLLTTNYDDLLEKAFKESDDFKSLGMTSFTFTQADSIAAAIFSSQFCIIHTHGLWNDIMLDDIVFTARDYTKMLKRRYPGFTMCMQHILLRYSTLFIGYGESDPHVEDLLEEQAFNIDYNSNRPHPKSYIVTLKSSVDEIQVLYNKKRRIEYIGIDTYDEYSTVLSRLANSHPRT